MDIGVDLPERRSSLTMGLLWVTMVTSFPTVLIGVEWHKQGFSLTQVIACTIFASNLLLLYTVPAGMVGATTGKTFGQLAAAVFGKKGCHFATMHVFWIFSIFYGMTALFMADAFTGLFHPPLKMEILTFVFALLMSLNNFWGFSGVVNFARFFAAPCLILWVLITFFRVLFGLSATPLAATLGDGHATWSVALTAITTFIIGFACWGNEADYWRHGRISVMGTAIPVAAALIIGEVIFPITGWMVAHLYNLSEMGAATDFLNKFSFGGLALLACLVIGAQYFASQDSNIYGVVSAVESFLRVPKKVVVFAYAILGGFIGVWLTVTGLTKSLEAITSLNAVFLPGTTVIVICEWLLGKYLSRGSSHLEPYETGCEPPVPAFYWPAIIALLIGYTVGVVTSGVVPGLDRFHVGIPFLFAWFSGVFSYIPLRYLAHRRQPAQPTA
ncbi:MAG: cytosine permease [Cyanobacteria bacterium SZAS TMP-1]|nr:cytosine permease [Cyanobacteria bacterium SZAS TMP-1]